MDNNNQSLKQALQYLNEQIRIEFQYLPTDRYHLLKQNKWYVINGVDALHGKYSPEQQVYALHKCKEIGIRATSRLLAVSRRTLQRWCRRYRIDIARLPDWMPDWIERKKRKRNFWKLRGY